MQEISSDVMPGNISGGMNLDGYRPSDNAVNLSGTNMGYYIDANNKCWSINSTTLDMFPNFDWDLVKKMTQGSASGH